VPEIAGWVILGLVSALCAALVAIFGKIGLEETSPVAATMARAVIMAAITTLAALGSGSASELAAIDRRGWFFITLVAFVVVLAAVFLGESFTLPKAAGAALMVVGALLIAR
jgi:transporter family protein